MIVIPCLACNVCMRTMGDAAQVDHLVGERSGFWPDQYPCIHCGALCRGLREIEADPAALQKMHVLDLEPEELFAALNGLGTPAEHRCTEAAVLALLQSKVKRVVGREVQGQASTRFVLESMEFEDGHKMFFGAAPEGALVYRISKPHSYVEAVDG